MADLYSTLGANAKRSVVYYPNTSVTKADPYSQFGTREITWYKVQFTDIGTNAGNQGSVFQQVIQGIQGYAELFYAATTAANFAVFAVAANTDNTTGPGANDIASLEAAIEAVTGNGATITSGVSNVFQTS